MDYLHTDIHLKATSEAENRRRRKTPVCVSDRLRTSCGSLACFCLCALISDASLALVLSKTGRFLPLARPLSPPLIAASWAQADSSSCLFSLIYQARPDKCKHLPEYSPHLGARGAWMRSILYPHMPDQCIMLPWLCFQCSGPGPSLLLSHLTQSHFLPFLPGNKC